MARSHRSSKLQARENRLKLPKGAREFMTIGKGLALAYRRTAEGYGTWQARVWDGGRYQYRNLGHADDHRDANGIDVLDFLQAQREASAFYDEATKGHAVTDRDATVSTAAERYLEWYKKHRRAYRETEHVVNVHILPALGAVRLADLSAPRIRKWHEKVAEKPARVRTARAAKKQQFRPEPATADERRARKSTANRILTVLKALLTRAFQDGLISDDSAWRQVKPFAKADEAKIRFLDSDEALRLVNATPPDLRPLVNAALLSGARFGELTSLRVSDVNVSPMKRVRSTSVAKAESRIYIAHSKSGKPRHVPLNEEGAALFAELTTGKLGDALVFTKADGSAWGKNHHVRLLCQACKEAKIVPEISFHELRHTYASLLAQRGVDLLTISKLLGHADTRVTAKHYAHLADKTLSDAVMNHLPSFGFKAKPRVEAIR